jgi:hypothetical protein
VATGNDAVTAEADFRSSVRCSPLGSASEDVRGAGRAAAAMSRSTFRPASEDAPSDRRGMVEMSPPRQLSCDVPFTYNLTPASPPQEQRTFKALCKIKKRKFSKQMSTLYDVMQRMHVRNSLSSDEERKQIMSFCEFAKFSSIE